MTAAALPDRDRHQVTALARGLQILRCFSAAQPELTAADVVRMTGLPQPTVWRLCRTLEQAGFIVCAGRGSKMGLGLPALALGYAALVRQPLPQIALPYMQAMTERHGLGLSLAAPDGLEMVYLQRTHGHFIHFNDPVGSRRPLVTAPTGWACLAVMESGQRARTLAALQQAAGPGWPARQAQIDGALAEHRQRGFITSLGVMHEQLHAIAVPVRSADGRALYGLSASGLASSWPSERLQAVASELMVLAAELGSVPATGPDATSFLPKET
jgi:DNA-binding IclR family transcriptional regulator